VVAIPGPNRHQPQRSAQFRILPASRTDKLARYRKPRRLGQRGDSCRRFSYSASRSSAPMFCQRFVRTTPGDTALTRIGASSILLTEGLLVSNLAGSQSAPEFSNAYAGLHLLRAWNTWNAPRQGKSGPTIASEQARSGAVSGARKQTTYAHVIWRVDDCSGVIAWVA
jgi:hypothetical protein